MTNYENSDKANTTMPEIADDTTMTNGVNPSLSSRDQYTNSQKSMSTATNHRCK